MDSTQPLIYVGLVVFIQSVKLLQFCLFIVAKFGAITPFHKNEMAHLYQGDIMGYGGRMVLASDGKKHFKIDRWPDGIIPYVITGAYCKSKIMFIESNNYSLSSM